MEQESQYIPVLMLAGLAAISAAGMLAMSVILGKVGRRNRVKDMPYECGMLPVGEGSTRLSVKFYLIAMLFLLFDIEAVFLFPWAVVYRDLKLFGFFEMLLFILAILAGYIYVWKKGALEWER
jgi:NADH-quinone oxidoreductase subunit A